jgi:hypothetical protein
MAEPLTIDNGTLTDFDVLVDQVTDGTLGTGHKQYVALMDGTINGTGKGVIDGNGLDTDVTRIAGKTPAYTEGDTDATIDGVPILWEDTSDTLRAASAAKPLPVNIITGSTAGVQYTEADVDTTITGTAVMWEDTSDTLRAASAAMPLPVNVVTGSAAGTQYTEGDIDTTITGAAVMWEDSGDTLRAASAAKPLPTNVVAADVTTDDVGAALVTDALIVRGTPNVAVTPKFAVIDHAAAGDNTLVASVASKKIRVHQCILVCSAGENTVRFESGAGGTALTGQMTISDNQGFVLPFSPIGWFETAATTLLNLELSAGTSVDGVLAYTEI